MFFPPPGPALCKLGLARSAVCSTWSPHSGPWTFLWPSYVLFSGFFPSLSFSHRHFGLLFPPPQAVKVPGHDSWIHYSRVKPWKKTEEDTQYTCEPLGNLRYLFRTTNECHSNEHPQNLVSGDKISQDNSKELTQLDRDCSPNQTGDRSSDPWTRRDLSHPGDVNLKLTDLENSLCQAVLAL